MMCNLSAVILALHFVDVAYCGVRYADAIDFAVALRSRLRCYVRLPQVAEAAREEFRERIGWWRMALSCDNGRVCRSHGRSVCQEFRLRHRHRVGGRARQNKCSRKCDRSKFHSRVLSSLKEKYVSAGADHLKCVSHESLSRLTGRGGTPHIAGMSLKETVAISVSLAAVFGAYAAVVEWVLHLELLRLGSGLL